MKNNSKVPIRVTIDGPECEVVTPIIPLNSDPETHQRHRQALIDAAGKVITISTEDVNIFHQLWDQQISRLGPSKTARYGIHMLQVGDINNAIIRPSFFVERNHRTRDIIADDIRFGLDRIASRLRRR